MTAPRLEQVAFSDPFLADVSEVFVTGPQTAPIRTLADAAGLEVHVRRSSSYYESLEKLQDELKKDGLTPIHLRKRTRTLKTKICWKC